MFANLACCSWNWKNGRSKTKSLWDLTADEFLDLPRHILKFATTGYHSKREISVVGRSVCEGEVGEGTNAVKYSGYFSAYNAAVTLKIEAKIGFSLARETNKNKKSYL